MTAPLLSALGGFSSAPAPDPDGWATGFDGMADRVVTDAESIAPCPDGWKPEDAVLVQPLACVLNAVERWPCRDGGRPLGDPAT